MELDEKIDELKIVSTSITHYKNIKNNRLLFNRNYYWYFRCHILPKENPAT